MRADNFTVVAEPKDIEKIQEQVQRYYKDDFKSETLEDANRVLSTYLYISMDEGYRKALKETQKDFPHNDVKIKRRKENVVEYVDEGEVKELVPFLRKRIKSKRQRKHFAKAKEISLDDFPEEQFVLTMVIHTGFEYGYMKLAGDFKEVTKVVLGEEKAELADELFKEVFEQTEGE